MKYLFGLLVFVLALVIPVKVAFGGAIGDVAFAGARYDKGVPVTVFQAGIGKELGGGLWSFSYMDIGNTEAQDISTEVAYMRTIGDFGIGILAGASADWEQASDVKNTYLTGLGGFIQSYKIKESFGLWSYEKFKFSFDAEDAYVDGFTFGVGLYFEL